MMDMVRDICDGWRSRPGRSLALGISCFLAAVALGQGMLRVRQAWQSSERILSRLPLDEQRIRFPQGIAVTDFEALRQALAPADVLGIVRQFTIIEGASVPAFILVGHPIQDDVPLITGRFLDDHDLAGRQAVAVVDAEVASEKIWVPGDLIVVDGDAVEIVGLADLRYEAVDVMTPRRRGTYRIGEVRVKEAGNLFIHERVRRFLQQPDWEIHTAEVVDWESLRREARDNRQRTLVSLTGLAVIVLGLTVLLQLHLYDAEVRERRSEIGLRLSLGATAWKIQMLFLTEALCLSLVGTVMAAFTFSNLGIACLSGFGVMSLNLLSVFFPSRRAARLAPVVCLRS